MPVKKNASAEASTNSAGSTASPQKRPATDDVAAMTPAKKVAAPEPTYPDLEKPQLPTSKFLPSRDVMKRIIPWVLQETPRIVKQVDPASTITTLPMDGPLNIDGDGYRNEPGPHFKTLC